MPEILHELNELDHVLYKAASGTDTPVLDTALRRISIAANHSKISFTVAALLALRPGRSRLAAVAGVCAIGLASGSANLIGKQLVNRPRPDRASIVAAAARAVPMPESASFPSGHTASAVAFATAVGSVLPATALPLGMLAATVGYSRIHTGVHYPSDVAAGAVLGGACGSVAVSVARAIARRRWLHQHDE